MNPCIGWAIAVGGEIKIRTVMHHRRGAIVNWLSLAGFNVGSWWSDEDIQRAWDQVHERHGAELVCVDIVPRPRASWPDQPFAAD